IGVLGSKGCVWWAYQTASLGQPKPSDSRRTRYARGLHRNWHHSARSSERLLSESGVQTETFASWRWRTDSLREGRLLYGAVPSDLQCKRVWRPSPRLRAVLTQATKHSWRGRQQLCRRRNTETEGLREVSARACR